MTLNKTLFSSVKTDWETPPKLFEELNAEFGFVLDVCAVPSNTKCANFLTPQDNSLIQPWSDILEVAVGSAYMNPPYGRECGKWVAKAYAESLKGLTVVGLLPARTDTQWFHDYVYGKAEVRFLKGRLTFVGAPAPAPFPSMVVVWRGAK